MTEKKETGHGGARPGAGRKKKKEGLKATTVRLSEAQIRFLIALGGGELSAGVRKLVDEKMKEGESSDRPIP